MSLSRSCVSSAEGAYWKEHERDFPVLSRLARDLLAVPATGAGVERFFNSTRDICHYRRGSLNEETIQDLMMMMYMCAQKFTLDNIQATHEEELTLKATEDEFELISDREEEKLESIGARDQAMQLEESDSELEVSRLRDLSRDISEELDREDEGTSLLPPLVQFRERSQKQSFGMVTVSSSRLQRYELY
ncbi:uncharacterized protein AFUA_4G03300 [Aspergillus fumigatus Af293]